MKDKYIIDCVNISENMWSGFVVSNVDEDFGTYESISRVSGALDKLLYGMSNNNKYGIVINDVKRKGDRKYTARVYSIPIRSAMECINESDAIDYVNNARVYAFYHQKSGHGCLVLNDKAMVSVERLFVLQHYVQVEPVFYYTKNKQKVSQISFSYDMFFSDKRQAENMIPYLFDGCVHVEQILIDPRNDARFIL